MNKLAIALGVAVALALGAPAQAQTVIKFSHVVARHAEGQGRRPVQEAGREVAPAAEEGRGLRTRRSTRTEELEALQLGAVQMLAPSLAKFGPLGVKSSRYSTCRTCFPTRRLRKVTEGPIGAALLKKLERQGHHRSRLLGQRLQGS